MAEGFMVENLQLREVTSIYYSTTKIQKVSTSFSSTENMTNRKTYVGRKFKCEKNDGKNSYDENSHSRKIDFI